MNYRFFNNGQPSAPTTNNAFLTFIPNRLFFTCLANAPSSSEAPDTHYFTIDQTLVYQNFYADFGPLNLANAIRFCSILQEKLREPSLAQKKLIFYSGFSSDKKANALFLICTAMMLIFGLTPEEAHRPMESIAATIMPFRDAGYGPDTYHISILDCMKGLYKARSLHLLDLENFDLEEYEYYEKVEHGDSNWLVRGKFWALASPKDDYYTGDPTVYPKTMQNSNKNILQHGVPWRLNDVVNLCKKNKITTMLRLNNKLYDRQRFIEQGIEHIELYFHDGSCPSDKILAQFLEIAENPERGALGVHCKAGLGRTGSLIAAYLMKHYKFTASEVIGYLRVMRPGSVVGPQQNWLQDMQAQLWAMGDADVAQRKSVLSNNSNKSNIIDVNGSRQYKNYVLANGGAMVAAIKENVYLGNTAEQSNTLETAVPVTKTTMVGNEILVIPVQPRKGSDGAIPMTPLVRAIDALFVDANAPRSKSTGSPIFSVGEQASSNMMGLESSAMSGGAQRYNMRQSTVAARTSRSGSITDESTPRSSSGRSNKAKVSASGSNSSFSINPLANTRRILSMPWSS